MTRANAKLLSSGIAVFLSLSPAFSQACEEHFIRKVSNHGRLIELEDGSLWQVRSADSARSSLWLQFAEVAVCGGMITNEDTGEELRGDRIR